ncbi:MAG: alanine--tRNA ligase [Proteobacteria bacterium]|nr:alanine--tRNA ligase [Pseudomonadota bacterium]
MSSQELRDSFLNYFQSLGHTIVPSSSLIPGNDPTLLFTNAGMVQFKDTFLGLEERPYQSAASVQRCVRAGGKHNDLENVGHTRRHHTFFEMLGNFSFGSYFKEPAIEMAWNFLTKTLAIPPEKLWITVFKDDAESEKIWLNQIKIDPKRFTRCGEKDNFWSMGDIGPCGPCTEIFYDHGPSVAGGAPGTPDSDGDRYVEIWNLVFMQYERDISGNLHPLPKPCVDTGMGLERIAAVMQGVHDNYDIDIFRYLLKSLSEITGCQDLQSASMRVIVDHIRSSAFLIADGVIPSNEGRGYVLRRIIRRAIRHGYKLGKQETFFYRLTPALIHIMGRSYPELAKFQKLIEQLLLQEEQQFSNTLENGLKLFDELTAKIDNGEIPGQTIFQLYDTYGFPLDLTADLARERGYRMDYTGFEQCMEKQRQQSQQSQHFKMHHIQQLHIPGETYFYGYESLKGAGVITTLLKDEKPANALDPNQRGVIVLDKTPFYAESGGQVGDSGYIWSEKGKFRVEDTQKHGTVYLHYGRMLAGKLQLKETVQAEVDPTRQDIMLNHSATHLLHQALRKVLGEQVTQKGSLVAADRLRFDFSYAKPLTTEQIQTVETMVNRAIRANVKTHTEESSIEEAKKKGAMALFGEKYGNKVRTVAMGEFSHEVCGGTHVTQTGQIGVFKIINQMPLASGIRRIEAVTGEHAWRWISANDHQLQEIAALLKVEKEKIVERLNQILNEQRILSKEMLQLKQQAGYQQTQQLTGKAVKIDGIQVIACELNAVDRETLRNSVDQLKQELGSSAIVLATIQEGKIQLISGVSKDCLSKFTAIELLNQVAKQVNGKGGGRPDLAQGGGENPQALKAALDSVYDWVREKLKK